jgi:DnaJ-class molecular chaperone
MAKLFVLCREMTRNHFTVLGLIAGASDDDIKKAYRTLAKRYHPDKNKEAGAEEKFKEIAAAYEILKDGLKREMYERKLTREKESVSKCKLRTADGRIVTTFSTTDGQYRDNYKRTKENVRRRRSEPRLVLNMMLIGKILVSTHIHIQRCQKRRSLPRRIHRKEDPQTMLR